MIELKKPMVTLLKEQERIFFNRNHEELGEDYGKFIISPLLPGYGVTLGNSLRRVLLSSLPGAAVTYIKIDGVLHEFCTIEGIYEDVTEIALNIKAIPVKYLGMEELDVYMDVVSEKDGWEVTAENIVDVDRVAEVICNEETFTSEEAVEFRKTFFDDSRFTDLKGKTHDEIKNAIIAIPNFSKKGYLPIFFNEDSTLNRVEFIDAAEAHIASLNKNVRLKIRLHIERNRGFVIAEDNRREDLEEVGIIYLDSRFTAIKKVNYITEEIRTGKDTGNEKLVLEVWTDGTMNPNEALNVGSAFLVEHFKIIEGFREKEEIIMKEDKPAKAEPVKDIYIKDLEFSVRSRNCLNRAGIKVLSELSNKSLQELMCIKNFGKKSLHEIREKLADYGMSLKGEEIYKKLEGGSIIDDDEDDDDDIIVD